MRWKHQVWFYTNTNIYIFVCMGHEIDIRHIPASCASTYSSQTSAAFTENLFGFSPGQGLTLHMMTSTAFPSQVLPPCWAGGSLQVRTLVLLPWPQVREHSSQRDHSDQLPSTVEGQRCRFCYHIYHLHIVSLTHTKRVIWILCVWFFKALSPGQGFPWQLRVSVSDPTQWRPPLAGRGLLHCLSLFCDPTPQDTLQRPHSAHSEKPPWTGKQMKMMIFDCEKDPFAVAETVSF